MIITVEAIIIAILFFVSFVSVAYAVRQKLQLIKVTTSIAQLVIDKSALQEELDRLSFISSNSTDIENGFVKFLSETRESAYEYIQQVQSTIESLRAAMLSGSDDDIAKHYQELVSFLPAKEDGSSL
jgi:biopolymer transport protein ExbB/TolQ